MSKLAQGWLLLATGLALAGWDYPASAADPSCPRTPSFRALEQRLTKAGAAKALNEIYQYASDPGNDDPNLCAGMAVDRLMGHYEAELATITVAGVAAHPIAVYHCPAIEPATVACNGIVADDTAHPPLQPPLLHAPFRVMVDSAIPNARLEGLYTASVADLIDGKPVRLLDPTGQVTLQPSTALMALIAVYSAPTPWHVRKLVWYYQ